MNKRRATLLLPPELWLCIFHHATHVPGTLVPDIYDSVSTLGPIFIEEFHPALQKALITKRALVRVCREWWHLAVPILYQSVYVGRVGSLYSLSRTLRGFAMSKGTVVSTRPLGQYTQRLDIVLPGELDDESFLLEALLECMPHLAVFSMNNTTGAVNSVVPDRIMAALHSCAPSLRVLDWSSDYLKPSSFSTVDLLANCTQLRVLICTCLLRPWEIQRGVIPPTVTTLSLNSNYAPTSAAPTAELRPLTPSALQELFLDFTRDVHTWDFLLCLYGPQLISVHFYLRNDICIDIYSQLHLFAQSCPNLRRLTITLTTFCNIQGHRVLSPPIPITYLGLRFDGELRLSPESSSTSLFMLLEHVRPSMPSLQVVQLLNEHHVVNLLKMHTEVTVRALRPFVEPRTSFRIEDQDGVLLTGWRVSY